MKRIKLLLIVLCLGGSAAFAQTPNPFDHETSAGFTHTYRVNDNDKNDILDAGHEALNTYVWSVRKWDGDSYETALPADYSIASGAKDFIVDIFWKTAGDYAVEVIETSTLTGVCTTTRQYYVSVKADAFDLAVTTSDTDICTDPSIANAVIVGTDFQTSERTIRVALTGPSATSKPAFTFDFSVIAVGDLIKVTSASAGVTIAPLDLGAKTGTVNVTAGNTTVDLLVEVKNTPGALQSLDLSLISAHETSTGNNYGDGVPGNNALTTPISIYAMPNTTVILVD